MFKTLLLTPFNQKLVNYALHNQSLNFLKKSDLNDVCFLNIFIFRQYATGENKHKYKHK